MAYHSASSGSSTTAEISEVGSGVEKAQLRRRPDVSTGSAISNKEARKKIGFVRQQDYLVEHLTGSYYLGVLLRLQLDLCAAVSNMKADDCSSRDAELCTPTLSPVLFLRSSLVTSLCLTSQAAQLRLPSSLSSEAIAAIVEQTIDELGLRDAADTVVGGPLRKGISGGEKRYVQNLPLNVYSKWLTVSGD